MKGCGCILQYKDLWTHLREECPHGICRCAHCKVTVPRQFIRVHTDTCASKLMACPICYECNIPLRDYSVHTESCLKNLLYL